MKTLEQIETEFLQSCEPKHETSPIQYTLQNGAFPFMLDFDCLDAYTEDLLTPNTESCDIPEFNFDMPEIYPAAWEEAQSAELTKRQKVKVGVLDVLFYSVLALIVFAAAMYGMNSSKSIAGYSFFNVTSTSMQSEIPMGSLVIAKKIDPALLKPNDDISFMKDSNTIITHRILRVLENYENDGELAFETKGIENDTPDFDVVLSHNVLGVVKVHVPAAGSALDAVKQHPVLSLSFFGGLLLFSYFLRGAVKPGKHGEEADGILPKRRPRSLQVA
ncbi:MAG: signal peptidase I [Oscillospiraceae bacterium]|jgi:signal peptidase I|nr:signal peptidase I [Oscillospiraceae bacterium]